MNMKEDDASNIQLAVVFTVVGFAIVCGCVYSKKNKNRRKTKERKMTIKDKRENKVFQNQTTISAISMEDETEMNRVKIKTATFTVEYHKTKIIQNRDTLLVEDETKMKRTKKKAASFTPLGVEHFEQVDKTNYKAGSLQLLTGAKKTKKMKSQAVSSTSLQDETQMKRTKKKAASFTSLGVEHLEQTKKMKSQAVSSTSLQDETQTQITRDQTISFTSLKQEIKKMKTTNQAPSSTSLAGGTKIARDQATSSTSLENKINMIKTHESINQATSTTSLTKEEKMKETKNQATSTTSLVNGTKSTKRKHDSSKSTNPQLMVSINQATSTTSLTNEEKTNKTNNQAKPSTSLINETKSTKKKKDGSKSTNQIKGSKEKEITPKGLLNMGNTCFMDAMLQNIAWCPKLLTELQNANLNTSCKMSNSVLKLLKYTHSEERNHKFPEYQPADILSAAREWNSIFDGYQQQDSFEMFNTIIDAIKEEMLKLVQKNDSNVDGQSEEEQIMNKPTGVRLFFGTFVTVYDYSSCEHIDCVFQRFSSMTVPIVETSENERYEGDEQQSSFEGLTGIERGLKDGLMQKEIFEEEIFSCRKCDQRRTDGKCEKTMLIYEAPSIMVVHIDRFRENYHGGIVKRNDKVTYPETLNIEEFCSKTMKVLGKDQPLTYVLFGVVAHSGSLSSGHYVAYIKTKQRSTASWYYYMKTTWTDPEKCREEVERKLEELKENGSANHCADEKGFTETKMKTKLHSKNSWFYISDSIVRMCKYEEVIDNKNAYVLLYERI